MLLCYKHFYSHVSSGKYFLCLLAIEYSLETSLIQCSLRIGTKLARKCKASCETGHKIDLFAESQCFFLTV